MSSQQLNCDVNTLYNSLVNKENVILIDVREYAEYSSERISQSQPIPLGDLTSRINHLDNSLPIYVICRSGRRSSEAQQKLLSLGFSDVRNVIGGMQAWQAAGLPVERNKKAVWSLERQVRFVAGTIVLTATLSSLFISQAFIWLAIFVGAGLMFAAITDSCAMAMLLARLPWNRVTMQNSSTKTELQGS
jgi:rhodanese-related sulfurtransferase